METKSSSDSSISRYEKEKLTLRSVEGNLKSEEENFRKCIKCIEDLEVHLNDIHKQLDVFSNVLSCQNNDSPTINSKQIDVNTELKILRSDLSKLITNLNQQKKNNKSKDNVHAVSAEIESLKAKIKEKEESQNKNDLIPHEQQQRLLIDQKVRIEASILEYTMKKQSSSNKKTTHEATLQRLKQEMMTRNSDSNCNLISFPCPSCRCELTKDVCVSPHFFSFPFLKFVYAIISLNTFFSLFFFINLLLSILHFHLFRFYRFALTLIFSTSVYIFGMKKYSLKSLPHPTPMN